MGVDPARVRIYHVEAVTWADSSLGCPNFNGTPEQVATPGFDVAIEAGGNLLDYHTDDLRNRVLLCNVLSPPIPTMSAG
jgi:hypothetical protein